MKTKYSKDIFRSFSMLLLYSNEKPPSNTDTLHDTSYDILATLPDLVPNTTNMALALAFPWKFRFFYVKHLQWHYCGTTTCTLLQFSKPSGMYHYCHVCFNNASDQMGRCQHYVRFSRFNWRFEILNRKICY